MNVALHTYAACSHMLELDDRKTGGGAASWNSRPVDCASMQHLNNLTLRPCVWLVYISIKYLHNHLQQLDECRASSQCDGDMWGRCWGWGGLLRGGGSCCWRHAKKKKRCDDGEELQLQKQIESLFLLKELPSSLECWPCGAEKQPSALQRSGPTTRSLELRLQCREIKWTRVHRWKRKWNGLDPGKNYKDVR